MALVIKTDNQIQEVIAIEENDRPNNLDWLQQTVGGYIECFMFRTPVPVQGKVYHGMMLNEEGKLMKLPVNLLATKVAQEGGLIGDVIVGNVVVFASGEID